MEEDQDRRTIWDHFHPTGKLLSLKTMSSILSSKSYHLDNISLAKHVEELIINFKLIQLTDHMHAAEHVDFV